MARVARTEINVALGRLQPHLQGCMCSVCKSSSWSMVDSVFELREFHGGDVVIGGAQPIIPLLVISCRNCGNTLFFNAIQLGAVKPLIQPEAIRPVVLPDDAP